MESSSAASSSSMLSDLAHEDAVRTLLSSVPEKTKLSGDNILETVLGFTRDRKSSNPNGPALHVEAMDELTRARDAVLRGVVCSSVDTLELEHEMYDKEGLMRADTVGSAEMVAIVHALNKVPHNAGPTIIRAVLFCALPLLLCGFKGLPVHQRAAFVCMLAPGIAGLLTMRNMVEAMETVSLKEELDSVTHACLLHDEGTCATPHFLISPYDELTLVYSPPRAQVSD